MEQTAEQAKVTKKKFRIRVNPRRDFVFIVIGMLLAFTLRFALVNSDTVHYHANFALYINGQRDEFKNFTFYEEIASCSGEDIFNPKSRVHMHGQVNDTVHVHDAGVTWGAFFANLGYSLSDTSIQTLQGTYANESTSQGAKKLQFVLNGEKVDHIANEVIRSEDRLLIEYAAKDETTLMEHASQVAKTAHESNEKPDPQSCSGGAHETFSQRLKRTLGLPLHKHSTVGQHED